MSSMLPVAWWHGAQAPHAHAGVSTRVRLRDTERASAEWSWGGKRDVPRPSHSIARDAGATGRALPPAPPCCQRPHHPRVGPPHCATPSSCIHPWWRRFARPSSPRFLPRSLLPPPAPLLPGRRCSALHRVPAARRCARLACGGDCCGCDLRRARAARRGTSRGVCAPHSHPTPSPPSTQRPPGAPHCAPLSIRKP